MRGIGRKMIFSAPFLSPAKPAGGRRLRWRKQQATRNAHGSALAPTDWQRYTFQTLLSGLFSKSNFFGKMSEEIFVAYETSVKDYVETMQNRNTREKTKEDVQLCEEILRKENVRREAHTIAPTELNKYLAEFFRSVRRINERGL